MQRSFTISLLQNVNKNIKIAILYSENKIFAVDQSKEKPFITDMKARFTISTNCKAYLMNSLGAVFTAPYLFGKIICTVLFTASVISFAILTAFASLIPKRSK